jgi:acetolactate synthase-1/3 small subunit
MRQVLSVLVQNQPGVLVRVASMFSRREFNIESLAVGVTQSPEYSRMTIVVSADEATVTQMVKQLEKLLEVVAVKLLKQGAAVNRGMTLIKVKADDANRLDVFKIAEVFRAKVIDVQSTTLVLEITGDDEKIDAFMRLLAPYGILETIRTGLIGLERGEHTIYEQSEEKDYYGENLLSGRL